MTGLAAGAPSERPMKNRYLDLKLATVAVVGLGVLVVAAGLLLLPRDWATASGEDMAAAPAATHRATGPSGLPVPRFVSLKTDRVNVRRGPSTAHQVVWVFAKKGLPVEIVAEFEHWRRIRDSEGEEGWVYHSLLAGRRMALVAPWRTDAQVPLLAEPATTAKPVAFLESGVVGEVRRCTGEWCRLTIGSYTGWLQQELVWGVYPGEQIN